MKKILTLLILSVFICNSVFAETVFYEDFTFYGKLMTDVRINKVERHHRIQVSFPSYLPNKIPFILNGHAYYKEIDDKPMILFEFDELSIGAEKHIPVDVLATAINGKKLKQATFEKQNRYMRGFKAVNAYTKEVIMFPINRYKYNPTVGKPSANTFIMLLEPVYATLGTVLFAISPVTALLKADNVSPDIKRGSVVEFEFLKEVSKQDLQRAIYSESL